MAAPNCAVSDKRVYKNPVSSYLSLLELTRRKRKSNFNDF